MPQLVFQSQTTIGQTALDHGITDIVIVDQGGGPVAYVTSGQNGGVTAYAIATNGTLSPLDDSYFGAGYAADALDALELIETANGFALVVAGGDDGTLTALTLDGAGALDGTASITWPAFDGVDPDAVHLASDGTIFMATAGASSLHGYSYDPFDGTLTHTVAATDTPETYADSVSMLTTLTKGRDMYLIGASGTENGVTAYRVSEYALDATGQLGAADGLGIMAPSAMITAEIAGRSFVLLASRPGDGSGTSGAITVMELMADGTLAATDHILDTQHTRFGRVEALEVVTHEERSYVIAAGADEGLSAFVLMPNGRLQLIDSIADTLASQLADITALAGHLDTNDTLRIHSTSASSAGISTVSLDLSGQGQTYLASDLGGTLSGSAADDILIGTFGDDSLLGGAGDDILEDGAGLDTLTGGIGADVFVLRGDGQADTIADFDIAQDWLDLSSWVFLYDPTQLTITETTSGATITYRSETLTLQSDNGAPQTRAEVLARVMGTAERSPGLLFDDAPPQSNRTDGSATGDSLDGGIGHDVLNGLGGHDTLDGGSGNDTLDGGEGDDVMDGGEGDDDMIGGFGADTLLGGLGQDTLFGGFHGDHLDGGDGNDTLLGGYGLDTILGGEGDDSVVAGHDADLVHGGAGRDTLAGHAGDDVLNGGDDDDRINGGPDRDTLRGDAGDDELFGNFGDDSLEGGEGHDMLNGGYDHDTLRGQDGDDALFGFLGNDLLDGGLGDDDLVGGDGHDLVYGDEGRDTLIGGNGDDTLDGGGDADLINGGNGTDELFGDAGNDTLNGHQGDDRIEGGDGADLINAGLGHDTIRGDGGNDTVYALDGDDDIDGGAGNDNLFAASGNDTVHGGADDDLIYGGDGDDLITGGNGNDVLWGNGGADTFVFADGHGIDTVQDFQGGLDLLDLTAASGIGTFGEIAGASSQMGNDLDIDTGGGHVIRLIDTTLADLTSDDFVF